MEKHIYYKRQALRSLLLDFKNIASPLKLVFIRHGQSIANQNGILHGLGDTPLSEKGREQASFLYPVLSENLSMFECSTGKRKINVHTSKLARAFETG